MAVQYNPALRQAANDHGPAAWGVRNAFAAFLPTVTASGGAGYQGPGSQTVFESSVRTTLGAGLIAVRAEPEHEAERTHAHATWFGEGAA